jgi:hypothetical protein
MTDGYGETPWYMEGELGWTPEFKDEHTWCTAALKAWPNGIPIPDKTPAVVTVLIHKGLRDYVFDENNRIAGVVATEKLLDLADEQSRKN